MSAKELVENLDEENEQLNFLAKEYSEIAKCFNIMNNLLENQGEQLDIVSNNTYKAKEVVIDGVGEEFIAKSKKYKSKIRSRLTFVGIGAGLAGTAVTAAVLPMGLTTLAAVCAGLTSVSAYTGRSIGSMFGDARKQEVKEQLLRYNKESHKLYEGEVPWFEISDRNCPHDGMKAYNSLSKQNKHIENISNNSKFITESAKEGYFAKIKISTVEDNENLCITEYAKNIETVDDLLVNTRNDKILANRMNEILCDEKEIIESTFKEMEKGSVYLNRRTQTLKKY